MLLWSKKVWIDNMGDDITNEDIDKLAGALSDAVDVVILQSKLKDILSTTPVKGGI